MQTAGISRHGITIDTLQMKEKICRLLIAILLMAGGVNTASAQLDWGRLLNAGIKGIQALTLSNEQVAEMVAASVAQMDKQNTVAGPSDPYTIRLKKVVNGINSVDGIPLNFKVYKVKEMNAFACPDGSVRVFSALMDKMDDDELLGVIGHEIGHVALHHSRNALKKQLETGALKDVLASTSTTIAALTDSQLGQIGEALISAKYSRKQESEADDYGYDFLVAHGRNPWAMAEAFEQLEAGSGAQMSGGLANMFSDHPDTQSRIKHIEKRCKKDGYTRPAEGSSSVSTTGSSTTKTSTSTSKSGKKKSGKNTFSKRSKKKKK